MRYIFSIILLGVILGASSVYAQQLKAMKREIPLPTPQLKADTSLEQAINQRRSRRRYRGQALNLEQISQLLWSAQGITDKQRGLRAAPSAGALYPMEIYLLKEDGFFHYLPEGHKIEQVLEKDLRRRLASACWGQGFVAEAPVAIVIAADYERVTSRYGQRGIRYTDIEAGHIAQNIHLQAVALGLDSVPVGAFNDEEVKGLLKLPKNEQPLYVIPVGYAR